MTTLSDSSTLTRAPSMARARMYAFPLLIAMITGMVVSFVGLLNTEIVNFQSPVFTESSVSYPVMNSATYNIYLFSSVLFIGLVAVSIFLLGYEAEVSGFAFAMLMVAFGVFAGITYSSSERQDVLPVSAEMQVLNSHFDEPFQTVIMNARSDKMYVDSDGSSYEFRRLITDKEKMTWALEKVK
jgi:hypothetical protein